MNTLADIHWTVSPEILTEPIPLRWYGLLFAGGFIAGFYIMQRFLNREGAPKPWLDSLLMYVIIGTIAGARIGHCVFYDWGYFKDHILEIFLPFRFSPEFEFTGFQGLASHGAAIGIILSLWIWSLRISKRSILWILDRVVIVVALAGAFIRTGNLMNHEIVGLPTDLPWAFIFYGHPNFFEPDMVPRHPTQIYEALGYIIIFGLLYKLYHMGWDKRLGGLFGLFLAVLFGLRFVVEFFKENQVAFEDALTLNMGQMLSIPFVLAGVYFVWRSKKTA